MGRKSMSGGVKPLGLNRIQFDFAIEGMRFRPTLLWVATQTNLRRARQQLTRIKARMAAGTFCFSEEFPGFRGLHSMLVKIADAQHWNKKTYDNAVSALRRAFEFGYATIPRSETQPLGCKAHASAKRTGPRSIPSAFKMPKH
jgi:hypothetical protein